MTIIDLHNALDLTVQELPLPWPHPDPLPLTWNLTDLTAQGPIPPEHETPPLVLTSGACSREGGGVHLTGFLLVLVLTSQEYRGHETN